ncbi:hypothetical protein CR203_11990 [Salipaludibacillus neizhouensis]|uniref:Ribosomal protein L7/L12 C-terminal domain-containing protein n=1 Tax=Salipaludibacillus neizhouensis TaxID=885475 RepID=A0A3A9KC81_9BACI|nr:hypothetical protein [Salipaludibacillus neizhouensis]RKL67223.1 hypothetical protein CR203_11990 [Salipaludibacillus neizhouensis]
MESTLITITFFMVIYLIIMVLTLEGRIRGLKYSLDQLKNQTVMSENPVDEELRELIEEGKDVKAVKKARETLGLSLLEGKRYIDKLKLSDR